MCDAGDLQGLAAYILHSARMLNAMHNSFVCVMCPIELQRCSFLHIHS